VSSVYERLKAERLERITAEDVLDRIRRTYEAWRQIREQGVKKPEPVITAAYVADWYSEQNGPWRKVVREHCESTLRRLHRQGKLTVTTAQAPCGGHDVRAYEPA